MKKADRVRNFGEKLSQRRRSIRGTRTGAVFLAIANIGASAVISSEALVGTSSSSVDYSNESIAEFLFFAAMFFALVAMIQHAHLRHIETIELYKGKPRCRQCGYLLIGNTTGACPECGLAIEDV